MIPHPATSASNPDYTALLDQRRAELRAQLDPIFARRRSFVWEVGAGHGHFFTAYAEHHSDQLCIGIDVDSERVGRATRKRDRAKLANLHFLRAEARLFLQTLPTDARIAALFILFPDPWPKLRHHKHRILQPDFLEAVARQAEPDCRLFFRTDYHPYFAQARSVVEASVSWRLVEAPWPFECETVFQRRAQRHESFVARLRRNAISAPEKKPAATN